MVSVSKKVLTKVTTQDRKCVTVNPKANAPVISITYLEKNDYGLQHLYKCTRGDNRYVKQFESFLEKARQYNSITELLSNHGSHMSSKNTDSKSLQKVNELCNKYNLEVQEFIHLHCCTGGTGEFVMHGFLITNRFEIVWLDPKHEIHKQ